MSTNPEVDDDVERPARWQHEIAALRPILAGCGLVEEIKWAKPCYSHDGSNIVILQEMKGFLAVMFFKGVLLGDPDGVLEDQGPNSRSARRMRITSVDDVTRLAGTIAAYVAEAIDNEDSGREVEPAPELVLVEELQARLDADPALRSAFNALDTRPPARVPPLRLGREAGQHAFETGRGVRAEDSRRQGIPGTLRFEHSLADALIPRVEHQRPLATQPVGPAGRRSPAARFSGYFRSASAG